MSSPCSYDHHIIDNATARILIITQSTPTMFENFSFDAASRSSSSDPRYLTYPPSDISMSSSRRSSAVLSPAYASSSHSTPYSISDLSRQFSEQSIRPRPKRTDSGYSSQRSSFAQEESSTNTRISSPQLLQPNSRQPSTTRAQRQDSTRLQTESSHLREISSLVQRMVDTRDQCSLCRPTSSHSEHSVTPSESEDDVGSMASSRMESTTRRHHLPYKRSTEVLKGRPGVSKDVRMRKSRSRMNMNANGVRRQ